MAQLVIAAAGAWIGGAVAPGVIAFGVTGAQAGWIVGSLIGSAFAPAQKSAGPRLADLSVGTSAYGTPIPYVIGTPRVAGQIVWASKKREIATTTSQGKGGGGSEYTSYTYDMDMLLLLSDNVVTGVSRIWSNGKLVYNKAATADVATLAASDAAPTWKRITFYSGAAAQLPDPTYEAAVGVGNAPAYRGRSSVFIEALHLGSSGQVPNLTFELATSSTLGGADTIFLLKGSAGTTTDSSPYATALTVGAGTPTQDATNQLFGADTIKLTINDRINITNDLYFSGKLGTSDFCFEMWYYPTAINATIFFVGGVIQASIDSAGRFTFNAVFGTSSTGISSINPLSLNVWHHLAVVRRGSPYNEMRLYVDGSSQGATYVYPTDAVGVSPGFNFLLGYNAGFSPPGNYADMRWTRSSPVYTANFTPPTARLQPLVLTTVYGVANVTVQAAVTSLCLRAGLSAAQFDTSALSAITTPVRAMAISQVSTVRGALETLAACYFFEAVLRDKIYFVPRAGAAVATLLYTDIGWSLNGAQSLDPLPLQLGNELELPARVPLTFWNVNADYQTDTQWSDRQLSGQVNTSAVQVPLGFTETEGKQIADARLTDMLGSLLTTSIGVNTSWTRLEPTDVILVTGADGSVYRMRITRRAEADGIITLDLVLDDASAFTQLGLTVGGTASQTVVVALPNTTLVLLDIPILRDVDDHAGLYVAVTGSNTSWHSAGLFQSLDNTSYTLNTTLSSQAVMGTCTSTLGDWTGGNIFDGAATLNVNVGAGALASYTTDDVLTGIAPAYLVGSEIVFARTATLVSTGIYTLSNFLRGRRGTEWASTGHLAGERFVALTTSGLRVITLEAADLGRLRYYKTASAGQQLSAVTAQSITPAGVGLECFSPVDARVDRSASDHLISWKRRTRLSTRLVGALSINAPLGEVSESYQVDIFASSAAATAGTPVLRTIAATTATCTYTSAQRATDGTGSTVIYMRVYQMSANVGRGYPLTTAA